MGRRILAIVLLVVAISIAIMVPVLAFSPAGSSLLRILAATTAPTATTILHDPNASEASANCGGYTAEVERGSGLPD